MENAYGYLCGFRILLHIAQTTYSRYENGILDVPSAVLITLANFYKVSIDYILGQTDNPKRYPGKKE